MGEHFCLKWNNHQENLTGSMTKLLDEQKFVDVSLVCEMKTFKAHQNVLSACSPYFEDILMRNTHPHPIIILKDVKEAQMRALLQYMYRGQVSVRDDELSSFLHLAGALKVRGLSDNKKEHLVPQLREEELQSSSSQNDLVTPPKRQKLATKILEHDLSERHHSDSQSVSSPSAQTVKGFPKPFPSTAVPYLDNTNESYLPSTSQGIKQESDNVLEPGEEASSIPQNLGAIEHRGEARPGIECNMESSLIDQRNYQAQKVELPKVPIPMTYNFSSQLQATSIPGLYPCTTKGKIKKEQPSTSYEGKPKPDSGPSSSFFFNQSVSVIKNPELSEFGSQPGGIQRKGGRFRPGWMENYSWLQYDECLNTMYCKTCRKWSSSVPDIRTSFVEGNGNFRLEIVNHHHKSKAHKLCMAKEEESIPRLDPIINEDNN